LYIISINAVFVNAGLIAFTGSFTAQYSSPHRVWIFIGTIMILLGLKELIAFLIPDVPLEVDIQSKRNKFFEGKVCF
jgi:Calcium-activated chloride channel